MGIIKAAVGAVGGAFADQWLEVVESGEMSDTTVFCEGVLTRRGQNVRGTSRTVSNGSKIRVYPNQFMMLVEGGKIIDYTAEEGYYTVNTSSLPSLFNGQFGDALKETFDRIRYGGETPKEQRVFFVNLQEIKGIKFGTRTPVNYYDSFYNAELFLRAHGTYSIKITDPLKFYAEAVPKNKTSVNIDDINDQYLNEFLEAFQTAINQMSADGNRISFVASKGRELSKYMANVLDEDWKQMRGMEIQAVGIASISYDEESQKLINIRNRGAMLSDPTIREGYVQGQIAEGINAAGSNQGGAMAGFMGVGLGMQTGGGFMGAASAANMQQMQMMGYGAPGQPGMTNMQPGAAGQAGGASMQTGQPGAGGFGVGNPTPVGSALSGGWTCTCGHVNTGKFCSECGSPRPVPTGEWTCTCGHVNTGKFCSECGKPRS
ncbi:MAG: virion core protein [Lachnospiraceae bacterium]|jgi:membrane protease subunit (stomatin/prohibitin family)|nr:virion core protein [Lachnospiraceae bacterium]